MGASFALLWPAPGVAAPQWRGPANVPPPGSGSTFDNQVVGTSDGRTVALWKSAGVGGFGKIWSSVRPPGGAFGTPLEVTATTEARSAPVIAAAPDGTVVAAWVGSPTGNRVRAAVLPSGGSDFAAPVTISGDYSDPLISGHPVAVAPGAGGEVFIAFGETGGEDKRFIRRSVLTPGGTFSPSVPISAKNSYEPEAAGNGKGDVVIIWRTIESGGKAHVKGVFRRNGAWTTTPQAMSGSAITVTDKYGIAIGPEGHFAGIWEDENSTRPVGARLTPGEVDRPLIPGTDEIYAHDFDISVGLGGLAVAVWRHSLKDRIQASVAPPGDGFGAPQDISPDAPTENDVSVPRVEFDATGRAIVTWHNKVPNPDGFQAAVLTPSYTFQRKDPPSFSAVGFYSDFTADLSGNTLLLRLDDSTTPGKLRVSSFDAAGPVLGPLAIPSAGAAGTPLSFGVGAVDAWSPLGPASWSFGDGGEAEGLNAGHTYAAPGTYSAAVSVEDSLGNESSAGGQVGVTGPASGGSAGGSAVPGSGESKPPVIESLTLSPRKFAVKPRRRARAGTLARRRFGTTFHFRLSKAATLTLAFQSRVPGVRSGGRCRPRKPGRRGRPCKRWAGLGVLTAARESSQGRFRFSGRLRGRPLRPGPHRAIATARDSDGKASAPRTVTFKVVR